jgi:hypothetical protein
MSEQLDPITNLPVKQNTGIPENFKIKNNKSYSPAVNLIETKSYSQADDYLSGVDPNVFGDTEKIQISDNQSTMESLGATTGRLLGNIVPEVIKGFALLEDVVTAKPDGNAISQAMDNWIDSVNESLPLYGDPRNKVINWENMSGLVNSMASFAITGMGIGSVLGKIGGASRLGQAAAQVGTATALTGIEGAMEANELLKNSYVQEFNRLYYQNTQEGYDQNTAMKMAETKAKENVESAAKTAMMTNYINVALNLTSAGHFIKSPKTLMNSVGRVITEPSKFMSKKTGLDLLKEGTQEALEEGVNVFAGATGKTQLQGKELTFDNIWQNVDKDELKTSMILGAIGGIGQTSISTGISNLNTKWYKGKNTNLREKYAEQKDFIDNVKALYNNPADQSSNILSSTHNIAMLHQAQELENAGDIEGAKKIRLQTMAYNAYESFRNDTWKDLRDVYNQLSENEQLNDDQKQTVKELVSHFDNYQKIFKENIAPLNDKKAYPFAMYSNRVNQYHLDNDYKAKLKELTTLKSELDNSLNEIDQLEGISELEKVNRRNPLIKSFNTKASELNKELSDINKAKVESNEKFDELYEANIDNLNLVEKYKKIYKNYFAAKKDYVNKATNELELDNALSKFEDENDRQVQLESAADRQGKKALNVDFTTRESFADTILRRWRNNAALARVEKQRLKEKLNIDFNSTEELIELAYGNNNAAKQQLEQLEALKQQDKEIVDNKQYDNYLGKTKDGRDVRIINGRMYVIEPGSTRNLNNIPEATEVKNISAKNLELYLNNKYELEEKRINENASTNIKEIKDFFSEINKEIERKLTQELEAIEASIVFEATSLEEKETGTESVFEKLQQAINSDVDNIPILQRERNKDGSINDKYDSRFAEGIRLIENGELQDKEIYFETTNEDLNRIGVNFENSTTPVTDGNFIVYLVYYKDGNSANKSETNRVLVGKLRADVWKNKKGENVQLSDSLRNVRKELLKLKGSDIVTLPVTTKVKSIITGKINVSTLRPLSEVLKPNESPIFGVVVKKGNILDLETNGAIQDMSTIFYDRTKLRAGGVYLMTKLPNGNYVPVQLNVKRINQLENAEEVKNKLSELLDKFSDPNVNFKELQDELSKYVYSRFRYSERNPELPFYTVRTFNKETGKMIRLKTPLFVSKEDMLEILMNDYVQVSSKQINKGNYNASLISKNALESTMMESRFTDSNIVIDYPTWKTNVTETTEKKPVTQTTTTEFTNTTQSTEEFESEEAYDNDSFFASFGFTEEKAETPIKQKILNNQERVADNKVDNKYVIDSELFTRVSDVINPNRMQSSSSVSSELGTVIDSLLRDYISGKRITKPDSMNEKAYNQLVNIFEEVNNLLLSNSNKDNILANNIVVFDSNLKVAGELDILVINNDGSVSIFDLKTSTSFANYDKDYRTKHTNQLSAYGRLFFNQYGIKVKDYTIIPIELNYTDTGVLIGSELQNFISLKYDSKIEEILEGKKVESTETVAEQPTANTKKEDITKQVGSSNKKFAPRKKSANNRQTVLANIEKELERLKRVLPANLVNKTKFVDEIEQLGDLITYGIYEDAVITLLTKTEEGTSYHEAIHAIIDLFLSQKQKSKLLSAAKKEYTPSEFELSYYSTLYPNATNEQLEEIALEEYLAEKFRLYALNQETLSKASKEEKSLFNRLMDWFKNIFNNLSNKNKIERFFKNTYEGKYTNTSKINNLVMNTSFSMRNTKPIDVFEKEKRAANIKLFYFDLINELKNLEQFKDKSDIKIISTLGFENLVSILATKIAQDKNAIADSGLDQDDINYYEDTYDTFLRNFIDLDNSDLKSGFTLTNGDKVNNLDFLNGSSTILNFKLNAELPLMVEFINDLNSMGINIKFKRKNAVKIDDDYHYDNENYPDEDNVETDDSNSNESTYTWQFKANEVSSETSFSVELRRALQSIRKSEDDVDDLGYSSFEDYNTVRNFLIENISDTYNKEQMMKKLKFLAPYSNYSNKVYEMALNDSKFATNLFIYIASKSDSNYIVMKRVNGEARIINSNRNNIKMLIIEDLKSMFNKSKVLTSKFDKTGINKIINVEEANVFSNKMQELEKKVKNNNNYNIVDVETQDFKLKDEVIDEIASVFKEYNIDISREQIDSIANVSKAKIYDLVSFIYDVTIDLKNNKNIFTIQDEQLDKEGTRLEKLAKMLVPVTKHKSEKSFLTINSTKTFSHSNTNFAKEFVAELKNKKNNKLELVELYLNDIFYSNSFMLRDFESGNFSVNDFQYNILDGSELIEDRKLDFNNMEPFDLRLLTIEAFYNQNRTTAWYRMPVFSDSPQSAFVSFKKIKSPKTSTEFWDNVYTTVLQEYNRMQFVKENEELFKGVKNVLNRNSKYILSPFMNTRVNGKKQALIIDVTTSEGKAKVIELAKEYYESNFQKEFKKLLDVALLSYNTEGELTSQYFSNSMIKNNLQNKIEEYFYNSTLVNSQLTSLFSGDPVYYKSNDDWQKRNKQVMSPILHLDDSIINPTYLTINIKDIEVDTTQDKTFNSFLDRVFEKDSKLSKIKDAYSKTSLTDAQSFITPKRYKEIMVGLNRWTPEHEFMFNKMVNNEPMNDKEIIDVYTEYWNLFGSIKPFDFHHNKQMTIDGKTINLIYPYQVKRAEFLLIPQVLGDKNRLTPVYNKAIEIENKTGKFVAINFDSAIKDGTHNVYSTLEDFVKSDDVKSVELANNRYGLQVEVPTHFIEDENNFGTQIMKLIVSGKNDAEIYTEKHIPNLKKLFGDVNSVTHKELTDLYKKLIGLNIESSFDDLLVETSNKKALKRLLKASAKDNKLPTQYYETIGSEFDDNFPLPLWFPPFGKNNESVLHSLIRNRVVKQKFPGASLVNVSSVGFDDNLKIKYKADGTFEHFEARLPYWTKKYFADLVDENGNIDIEALKAKYNNDEKLIGDLLDVIAYRIPTEWKHSMFKIRVVGFMHPLQGGAIQLPTEATTISGFDFDIDKLYAMFPSIDYAKSKETGRLERYDYNNESILDKSQSNYLRYNALLDLMNGVLNHESSEKDIFEPSSFEDLKITAQRIYLADNGYTDAFSISENEVEKRIKEEELDLTLPSTQYEYIERNRVGKALIGFFANHNTCHSFFEKTQIESKTIFKFNNEILYKLNQLYNLAGEKIGKVLASCIASATDNAKDPIASFMNLNTFTVDTYATLYRLGFPKETVQLFMSQPILKSLANDMLTGVNNESRLMKAMEDINNYFEDIYSIDNMFYPKKPEDKIYNLTDVEMKNAIVANFKIQETLDKIKELNKLPQSPERDNELDLLNYNLRISNKEYFDTQFKVFSNFKAYYRISQDVGNVSTSIKIDSTNNRSSLIDTELMDNKFKSISLIKGLANIEDIFDDQLLGAFYDYGIAGAKEIYSELFPWLNDNFTFVRNYIVNSAKATSNRKVLNRINYLLLTGIASDFEFFAEDFNNDSMRNAVMINMADTILAYIENNPDSQYTPFLRRFQVKTSKFNDFVIPNVIEFYKNGINSKDKQSLMDKFKQMLSEDPSSKEYRIAKFLVLYSFYKNGFTSDATSYTELIPPSFYINLKDSKGVSFVDYLTKRVNNMDQMELLELSDRLIRNSASYQGGIGKSSIKMFTVGQKDDVGATHLLFDLTDKTPTNLMNLKNLLTDEGKFTIFADPNGSKVLNINYLVKYFTVKIAGEDVIFRLNEQSFINNKIEYYRIASKGIPMLSLDMHTKDYSIANQVHVVKEDSQPTMLDNPITSIDLNMVVDKDNLILLTENIQATPSLPKEQLDNKMNDLLSNRKSKTDNQLSLFDEMVEESTAINEIVFKEEQSSGYKNRTIKNASADATIAIAVDFETAGEKLTKSSVLNQNKLYLPVSTGVFSSSNEITLMAEKIVSEIKKLDKKQISLNIAGNGIYSLKETFSGGQESVDNFTLQLLTDVVNKLKENNISISLLRTGGQTGFDEAGAKAGYKLGIPTMILAPKGWIFRDINGKDISDENQFKARFKNQITNNNLSEEDAIIDTEEYSEDGGYYDNSSFMTSFGLETVNNANKEILDSVIDLYPIASDEQLKKLNELGIESLEQLRQVDINNNELMEKLNNIKCM